mmetsp:Transcript_9243/g.27751  ORF Transcript_9243/g.27751 Transcript_9243/m.27751 type:complete len:302 (+) Transcript_9243:2002-2907(+)
MGPWGSTLRSWSSTSLRSRGWNPSRRGTTLPRGCLTSPTRARSAAWASTLLMSTRSPSCTGARKCWWRSCRCHRTAPTRCPSPPTTAATSWASSRSACGRTTPCTGAAPTTTPSASSSPSSSPSCSAPSSSQSGATEAPRMTFSRLPGPCLRPTCFWGCTTPAVCSPWCPWSAPCSTASAPRACTPPCHMPSPRESSSCRTSWCRVYSLCSSCTPWFALSGPGLSSSGSCCSRPCRWSCSPSTVSSASVSPPTWWWPASSVGPPTSSLRCSAASSSRHPPSPAGGSGCTTQTRCPGSCTVL